MSNDLGVWKAEDCALLLIDYQNEMFEVIRSEPSADLVETHVRLLGTSARRSTSARSASAHWSPAALPSG
jgi:nicotinamidase-related amidase